MIGYIGIWLNAYTHKGQKHNPPFWLRRSRVKNISETADWSKNQLNMTRWRHWIKLDRKTLRLAFWEVTSSIHPQLKKSLYGEIFKLLLQKNKHGCGFDSRRETNMIYRYLVLVWVCLYFQKKSILCKPSCLCLS